MIEALRGWLTSLIYTAMVIAVAEDMAPPGGMKKIVSMAGGLILLVMLVKPLESIELDFLQLSYNGYVRNVEERQEELEKDGLLELERLIEQRTAAYISDKAKRLGLDCQVTVRCKTGEEGVPYPYSVTVRGTVSEELKRWIAEELGISTERQVFHGAEG